MKQRPKEPGYPDDSHEPYNCQENFVPQVKPAQAAMTHWRWSTLISSCWPASGSVPMCCGWLSLFLPWKCLAVKSQIRHIRKGVSQTWQLFLKLQKWWRVFEDEKTHRRLVRTCTGTWHNRAQNHSANSCQRHAQLAANTSNNSFHHSTIYRIASTELLKHKFQVLPGFSFTVWLPWDVFPIRLYLSCLPGSPSWQSAGTISAYLCHLCFSEYIQYNKGRNYRNVTGFLVCLFIDITSISIPISLCRLACNFAELLEIRAKTIAMLLRYDSRQRLPLLNACSKAVPHQREHDFLDLTSISQHTGGDAKIHASK